MDNPKRRLQLRTQFTAPLPAILHHRSLRDGEKSMVKGVLLDANKAGMGLLVQEPIALSSQCSVELSDKRDSPRFEGEICYATKLDNGIRLGIELDEANAARFHRYLRKNKWLAE